MKCGTSRAASRLDLRRLFAKISTARSPLHKHNEITQPWWYNSQMQPARQRLFRGAGRPDRSLIVPIPAGSMGAAGGRSRSFLLNCGRHLARVVIEIETDRRDAEVARRFCRRRSAEQFGFLA